MSGRALLLALLLATVGCAFTGATDPTRRVATQEDAGSVHFAVVSVGRWEEFVDDLQPEFLLTPEGALERVLAPGRFSSLSVEDRVGVGVSAGPAGTGAAAPDAGPPAESHRPLYVAPPQADAMTQYQAATALYQEVQLLSRYVRHAAIRTGYQPYVLRMQVTLMPRARHQPYDAYATVSFFWTGTNRTAPSTVRGDEDGAPSPGTGILPEVGPQVLPLLVTDNLESAIAARNVASGRALALGLGEAGAAVGVDAAQGRREEAEGLDLNSILTVARVSDNTLRVRLGAMQQGTTRFAMVPRTHNITVLVMLPPRAPKSLQLTVRTVMVDAETGVELPPRSEERIRELLAALDGEYGIGVERLRALLVHAQRNETTEYLQQTADVAGPETLWLDLVSIGVGGQYASTLVDLEPEEPPVLPPEAPPAQTVFLADDGESCRVELTGGRHLRRDGVAAILAVPQEGGPPLEVLPVRPAELGGGGRILILVFPSLHARQLPVAGLRLRLEYGAPSAAVYDDVQWVDRLPRPGGPR